MMVTNSQIRILYHLLLSEGYISSHRLSVLTRLSRRRVHEEMKRIRQYCEENGVLLNSSTSKGFLLERTTLTDEFIQQVFKLRIDAFEDVVTYENVRRNHIMNALLREKDHIREKDLAERLYMSQSTVAKEMAKCRTSFSKYNLKLESRPYYGLKVIGSEIDKRRELINFYMTDLKTNDAIYDFMDTFMNDTEILEKRIYDLLEENLSFTDFQICDFFIILVVTIERNRNGFIIEQDVDISYGHERITDMIPLVKKIAVWIEEDCGIRLNENEIKMLSIELICRSTPAGEKPKNSIEHLNLSREILDEIYDEMHIRFDDEEFVGDLAAEFGSLIFRNHYHERNRTPLYRYASETYPLAYQLAKTALRKLGERYGEIDSDSELFQLTVLFDTEIHKDTGKIRALLLSSYDEGYTEMIRNKLQYNLYRELNIIDTCFYHELGRRELTQYDLVISTFQFHKDVPVSCLMITPKCTEEDIEYLRYSIENRTFRQKLQYTFLPHFFRSHVTLFEIKEISKYIYDMIRDNLPGIRLLNPEQIAAHTEEMELYDRIGLLRLPISLGEDTAAFTIVLEHDMDISDKDVRIIIVYFCGQNTTSLPDPMQIGLKKNLDRKEELDEFLKKPDHFTFMELLIGMN